MRAFLLSLAVVVLLQPAGGWSAQAAEDSELTEVETLAREMLSRDFEIRERAIGKLVERGNTDAVPALIQALRFLRDGGGSVLRALVSLTGDEPGSEWHEWMLWQEAHTEIVPFEGFDAFKADLYAVIDPNFRLFLRRGIAHDIRLEEITWGGVVKDGIPALINPKLIDATDANYLTDGEQVFGVSINGDSRAYPLRIMDWHEMFNDVIGGVPVALAYCTLCGSGILYDTRVEGRDAPFVFGSSGFLYRSNKLMYDLETNSLWNQFFGKPVVGPLTGSGIELKILPVAITSWAKWRERHPDTKVLSLDTGYLRDYRPGRPYADYFASPNLMFPALVPDGRLKPKDQVFALRADGEEKAWRLSDFAGGKVINGTLGPRTVVLIGDAETRTVRAYDSGGRTFAALDPALETVSDESGTWRVEEDALTGPGGERLERLGGHIAYWFAWTNFRNGKPLAEASGRP